MLWLIVRQQYQPDELKVIGWSIYQLLIRAFQRLVTDLNQHIPHELFSDDDELTIIFNTFSRSVVYISSRRDQHTVG